MRRAASLPSSARREEKREREREEKRLLLLSSPPAHTAAGSGSLSWLLFGSQFICCALPPTLWLSFESAETAMIAHFLRAYGWTMWWWDSSLHLREPDQRHPMETSSRCSSCWAAQWRVNRHSSVLRDLARERNIPPPFEQVSLSFEVAYLYLRFPMLAAIWGERRFYSFKVWFWKSSCRNGISLAVVFGFCGGLFLPCTVKMNMLYLNNEIAATDYTSNLINSIEIRIEW